MWRDGAHILRCLQVRVWRDGIERCLQVRVWRDGIVRCVQVRVWRDGTHIKNATDYDAVKETDLHISGLRHDVLYKLRVFGYSRAGDGTMSSPTVKFQLGKSPQRAREVAAGSSREYRVGSGFV